MVGVVRKTQGRSMRIVTTSQDIKEAITIALAGLPISETDVATVAQNCIYIITNPPITSDITGFPDDDDIENMEIERRIEEAAEDPDLVGVYVKIRGFPRIKTNERT
jgi:hypothetical protein